MSINIAVIDSGIDYTHAALGGSGDPADFAGNDPDIIEPGTFPTAKVVGGWVSLVLIMMQVIRITMFRSQILIPWMKMGMVPT